MGQRGRGNRYDNGRKIAYCLFCGRIFVRKRLICLVTMVHLCTAQAVLFSAAMQAVPTAAAAAPRAAPIFFAVSMSLLSFP